MKETPSTSPSGPRAGGGPSSGTASSVAARGSTNGTDGSSIPDFPFIVSLRNPDGRHICAGSIVDPYWVLTAASCAARLASNFTIQLSAPDGLAKGTEVSTALKVHINFSLQVLC